MRVSIPLCLMAAGALPLLSAAENREKPYVDDPKIVETIQGIPDNTSVELPPYTVDGKDAGQFQKIYGTAPDRRDYCNKIVYAPDRGTGMYCGGNHGAPRLCDAWEYHPGSNSWNLLFMPDEFHQWTKGLRTDEKRDKSRKWVKENIVVKDGYLQTKRGGMVRVAHTWDGLTYDHEQKRMLWAVLERDERFLDSFSDKEYAARVKEDLAKNGQPGSSIWMYDAKEGRWFKQVGPGPHPRTICMGGSLVYVPDVKKTIWYANGWNEAGTWAYDSHANSWTNLKPNGGKSIYGNKDDVFPQPELQAAYSSKHRKIVTVSGKWTHWYDIDKNEWSKACKDEANYAADWRTVFAYDSVNDVFLLAQPKDKWGEVMLRAYRVETNNWETLAPEGAGLSNFFRSAGYFDPRVNAFIVYQAKKGTMWMYRYKRAPK